MKYTRLSKQQFEALHEEFINFLASQTITAAEWDVIKRDQPQVAEDELDIFSDLIWEGALSKAEFLENCNAQQLFLIKLGATAFSLIHIKVSAPEVDITTAQGLAWLNANIQSNSVQITKGTKEVGDNRNLIAFGLIQQGAQITSGELYTAFEQALP